MARPTQLDLTASDLPWRAVPMDGANVGIEVVPLASHPDDFVILAKFPAGFVRHVPGGYHAAETFVVIDGELTLDGRAVARGNLTHIPAEAVRTGMHTENGCLALAWFSGPATFLAPEELGTCELQIRTVSLPDDGEAQVGELLDTPEAVWSIANQGGGERIDLELGTWRLDAPEDEESGLVLVRSRG